MEGQNKERIGSKRQTQRFGCVVSRVKGLSEAYVRILKSHGITTANHPHRILRNILVHPKDKVKDEEKTELIYQIPCKNCPSSYVGETGRKLGLRMKEH